MPHILEGHFPPLFLACKKLFPGTSCTKKTNRNAKENFEEFKCKSPFKFFIVEEVMSSSLITFEFEFTGEGESHFIPSHSKVFEKFQTPLKFQLLNQTNKQSNNYFNIPKH